MPILRPFSIQRVAFITTGSYKSIHSRKVCGMTLRRLHLQRRYNGGVSPTACCSSPSSPSSKTTTGIVAPVSVVVIFVVAIAITLLDDIVPGVLSFSAPASVGSPIRIRRRWCRKSRPSSCCHYPSALKDCEALGELPVTASRNFLLGEDGTDTASDVASSSSVANGVGIDRNFVWRKDARGANAAISFAKEDEEDDETSSSFSSSSSSLELELESGMASGLYVPLMDARERRLSRLNRLIDVNREARREREERSASLYPPPYQLNDDISDEGMGGASPLSSRTTAPPATSSPASFRPTAQRTTCSAADVLGPDRLHDDAQLESVTSSAPAVLLRSGPGTGKSSVLAARIAYLLRAGRCEPERLVVLSFANRDAAALKRRALELLHPDDEDDDDDDDDEQDDVKGDIVGGRERKMDARARREELSRRIWSGTVHSFALFILRERGGGSGGGAPPPRVVSAKEMRRRVQLCIQSMIRKGKGKVEEEENRPFRRRFKDALDDAGLNLGMLVSSVVRCVELWKEAALLPPPSFARSVGSPIDVDELRLDYDSDHDPASNALGLESGRAALRNRERRLREDCVELAMRLGIPPSAAVLALDVYPEYNAAHVAAGTVDPSDLASVVYDMLLSDPAALAAVRTGVGHVILDEYQDVSVAQHRFLRLVIRGVVDEDGPDGRRFVGDSVGDESVPKDPKMAVLADVATRRVGVGGVIRPDSPSGRAGSGRSGGARSGGMDEKLPVCHSVPRLFCAGDSDQSIYGWRGAAPSLSVEGFRRDYPQCVVVPLGTCYRLPRSVLSAAGILLAGVRAGGADDGAPFRAPSSIPDAFPVSPAGARMAADMLKGGILGDLSASLTDISGNALGLTVEDKYRLGQRLLSKSSALGFSSVVLIQGLWDAREEAKYIASTIRKRSKERRECCMTAIRSLSLEGRGDSELVKGNNLIDPTDIAIMVRSMSQMKLIEEALSVAGVPYVIPTSESPLAPNMKSRTVAQLEKSKQRPNEFGDQKKPLMKPVLLMTMHRAKGDEFDDVYVAGVNEGVFPHPTSVSSNRIHEERRLAYVTLTRARQRVTITYCFFRRVAHVDGRGRRRSVVTQVRPSRFLEELMPPPEGRERERRSDDGVAMWSDTYGFKESVAGRNLPAHFSKSFRTPDGFRPVGSSSKPLPDLDVSAFIGNRVDRPCGGDLPEIAQQNEGSHINPGKATDNISVPISPDSDSTEHLLFLREAFREIASNRVDRSCKKYRDIFRKILRDHYDITRGTALVHKGCAKGETMAMDILIKTGEDQLARRALSKCTAKQLGQYLAYLILRPGARRKHK